MARQLQKPKKRKAALKRPKQKVHKIKNTDTPADIRRKVEELRKSGKLQEAIEGGAFPNDNIGELITDTVSGIHRMVPTLHTIDALLSEKVLTPENTEGYPALKEKWDRTMIRFEENAETYLFLKEAQMEQLGNASTEELKDDTALSDIVFDLITSVNDLFLECALAIGDIVQQHEAAIDEYIKDHTLDSETMEEYCFRITANYVELIRPVYRTQLFKSAEETMAELTAGLVEGEHHA